MSNSPEANAPSLDAEPPMALDKFLQDSGISSVTAWRFRRRGFITTMNINGRQYITRAEIARFNKRAADGEFAAPARTPRAKAA